MKKIKVGLVGYGLSGKSFHARLLSAHGGYELCAVASSKPAEVLKDYPDAKIVSDPSALMEMLELDLVVIASPNAFHFSYAKAALLHQKHVVVEKPFVNSNAEGQELIQLAKKFGRVLTVFQNRRFDGDFITVQKLISSGVFGEIKQFESHFDRFRPVPRPERWREQPGSGSGILYDLGSHLIDQMLQLFGPPQSLFADLAAQRKDRCQSEPFSFADDYFHLIFYYGNMRAILHSSSFSSVSPRFQIFGERGTFMKFGFDSQESQLREGISPNHPDFGIQKSKAFGTLQIDATETKVPTEKGNYLEFYEELYQAIATEPGIETDTAPEIKTDRTQPSIRPEEACEVIRLIELAMQSSKLGRKIPTAP